MAARNRGRRRADSVSAKLYGLAFGLLFLLGSVSFTAASETSGGVALAVPVSWLGSFLIGGVGIVSGTVTAWMALRNQRRQVQRDVADDMRRVANDAITEAGKDGTFIRGDLLRERAETVNRRLEGLEEKYEKTLELLQEQNGHLIDISKSLALVAGNVNGGSK